MKTLFTLLISLFSLAAFAQVSEPALLWLKGYGGNGDDQVLTHVTKTDDGGFILCIQSNSDYGTGNIDSFCSSGGGREIFLKYNANASILEWSKCYGFGGDSFLEYMFPVHDGGAVFGGEFTSGEGWGFYICKQDVLGNIVWSRGYSKGMGPLLSNVIATNDGGYIMSGQCYYIDTNTTTHYGSSMTADIWILKLDSLGNKVWSKVIGGSEDDDVFSVVPAPRSGCYIVGKTQSGDYDCTGYHAGGDDAYIARLDSNGNLLWHRDLGGSGADGAWGWGVADNKGGVLIATRTNSGDGDVHHYIGGFDYWVLDIDSSSNIVWDNCYGGPLGDESAMAICKATDGSIWITGTSGTPSGEVDITYGHGDAWVVHTDSIGNFLSAKVLGSSSDDWGQMVYPLTNASVITGGFYTKNDGSFSSFGFYDILGMGSFDAFLAVFASWTTGIAMVSLNSNRVSIYPNPATDEVNITMSQAGNYQIKISDVIGKTIYKANLNDKVQIPVTGWVKGMYYVQVSSSDGYESVQKMIVE